MKPANLSLIHLVRPPLTPPAIGEKAPLLLLLHGVGSHEGDLFGLADDLDPRFFVVSARAPLARGGGFGWYPVEFTDAGPVADETQATKSRDLLLTFIAEAVTAYDLDKRRVFLTGFSQGAIMSLYLVLSYPETVAGVAVMSGRLLESALMERASDDRLAGLPILAVHGLYDTVLPITEGRRIGEELAKLPVALTYHEYPMAHSVSAQSFAQVTAFLTAQLG